MNKKMHDMTLREQEEIIQKALKDGIENNKLEEIIGIAYNKTINEHEIVLKLQDGLKVPIFPGFFKTLREADIFYIGYITALYNLKGDFHRVIHRIKNEDGQWITLSEYYRDIGRPLDDEYYSELKAF